MIFNMSTGGASTADKIKYDNTESGLQSTNVQGAVDELNSSLKFLPDYENAIQPFSSDISSSTTYTAPNDGIFVIRWYVTDYSGSTCQAKINNVIVGETTSTGWVAQPVLMKKGDVLSFTLKNAKVGNYSRFVPYA